MGDDKETALGFQCSRLLDFLLEQFAGFVDETKEFQFKNNILVSILVT